MEMSEAHDSETAALQNGDVTPEKESIGLADAGTVVDQVPESADHIHHVESKEDMFVDAPDDMQENQFQEAENSAQEDDDTSTISKEFKNEREKFAREIANLHHQLKALTGNESLHGENGSLEEIVAGDDTLVREMISECSQLVKAALEEREQSERAMRKLHEQIEDLNGKVQVEENVDVVADRMLASVSMVVNQEELLDYSVMGKITHVERSTSMLVEQYRWFLYEMDQLRQCLTEIGSDMVMQEEFGYGSVFATARAELLELKQKGVEMVEKLSHLEDENRQLIEEVEKEKALVENANAELGKVKVELDQEKNRCVNTKEKLSMAVTKGKALVQQRDSLKQSLAEKTSELEKCLAELHEKSSALEAAELCKDELVKYEGLVSSLQETLSEKNTILEAVEEIFSQTNFPEEMQSLDVIERFKWLMNSVASLQQIVSEKNTVISSLEELFNQTNVPEELKSTDIVERLKWLVDLVASLQKMLSQRAEILEKIEEIFSQVSIPTELQSADTAERLKWVVEDRNALKDNVVEFLKLKDVLSSIDLPDAASSSDFETRIGWLKESATLSKGEIDRLHAEIARIEEAAQNKIDRLSASLLAESQEKEFIKTELDDLACKYEEILEKAHQSSSEKDQIVRLLLERSGLIADSFEEATKIDSDPALLINQCIGKMKERSGASDGTSLAAAAEAFERMQGVLYVRDQELMLCREILEEDFLVRLELNKLSNELTVASLALATLKEEKDTLQKNLDRSEEKSSLVREKLSMAVKKGKGLVQDRENLKLLLEEKNSEIEKLKVEIQQQESAIDECKDQITRLSTDLEQVPKLEADLVAMKDHCDQLQQSVSDRNNLLQRVIKSIDHIVLPVDSVFEEPVEKVNWVARYIDECQQAKIHAEQELEKVEEETSTLSRKLTEALKSIKPLEDSLSAAEKQISQLVDEKREIEIAKENVEQDLEKARDEASTQTGKFIEACGAQRSLEDALSLAENNISLLVKEREEAQLSNAAKETELEKVREEFAVETSKLTEAYSTVKSLEDALSRAEANISLLTEQNNHVQIGSSHLESEIKKMKDEAESWAGKLSDASTTINTLEEALLKSANDVSTLENEKKNAEHEIAMLNSKLKACMEELAGTSGNLESRSMELIGHLSDLQMLLKNDSMLCNVKAHFEKEFENLKNMDLMLKDIRDHFVDTSSELLPTHFLVEEDELVTKPFPCDFSGVDPQMDNDELIKADGDSISLYFKKTADQFELRNKTLADNFEVFCTFVNEVMEALLRKLRATKDAVVVTFKHLESMKEEMKIIEMHKEDQETTIATLQNERRVLLSACTNATRELQFEVKNSLLELNSVPELSKLKYVLTPEVSEVGADDMEHQQTLDEAENIKVAENLLIATRKVQTLTKLFESTSNIAAVTIEDLQSNLRDARAASEKAVEEKAVIQNRVSELETDVESLQNSCEVLNLKLGEYDALEETLQEKNEELSNLQSQLLMREKEAQNCLMSTSQLEKLFDKIRRIEVPFEESEREEMEPYSSTDVKKLFAIVDSTTELHHQIKVLSNEKDELQSTLSRHILEIERMEEGSEIHTGYKNDFERLMSEMSELSFGLEKIVDILGGHEIVGDQKSSGLRVLPVLEKRIMALLLDAENSKSQAQELHTRLLGSQKAVDELSTRLKLLEDSLQSRTAQPEIVQERNIFEAPSLPAGSEISEIEDVGPVAKKTITPVPSAAHVRTMRKGSTDHLALDVDLESATLINNELTDEDKGHMFKSLNTSGFIPKQGKLVADRIDGLWVSGGRVLMNRPRARLGLIAYSLIVHLWLLGTIL